MSITEKEFEDDLDVFRVSAETAAQFFYAFQAIHLLSSRDNTVLGLLNQAPMFWNTSIGALQEAMFIALSRVFDQDGQTHNIDRLLKVAQDNPDIFKASAPRWRKQAEARESLDYVAKVYEPQPGDWRRLRKHVSSWRSVYMYIWRTIGTFVTGCMHIRNESVPTRS